MSQPPFRKTLIVLLIAGPVLLLAALLLMLLTSAPLFKYGLAGPLLLAAVVAVIAAVRMWLSARSPGSAVETPVTSLTERLDQLFKQLEERYEQDGITDIGRTFTWIILLGPMGSGKTSSLRGAGFVPMPIETVHDDGTRGMTQRLPDNCSWWESRVNRTIALELELDPNGGYAKTDVDSNLRTLRAEWRKLLRWLGRRQLLDAVIVQMGVDQLDPVLRDVEEDLGRHPPPRGAERVRHGYLLARLRRLWPARLREHFDQVRALTLSDPPVYVVLSRSDCLPGFTPFCTAEPSTRSWGGGIEPTGGTRTRIGVGLSMKQELARIASDLEDRAAARFPIPGAALAALRFPKEFALRSPLWCTFVEAFYDSGLRRGGVQRLLSPGGQPTVAPYLRGFYLCSAVQGGAPLPLIERPALFALLRGEDVFPPEPPGSRALFLGYFAELQKYARQEQRLRLSSPPRLRYTVVTVVCLLGALFIGLAYRPQRQWLQRITKAASDLGNLQQRPDPEHRLCEQSLLEYKRLLTSAESRVASVSSVDFSTLHNKTEEKLRAHIERHCVADILPQLTRALGSSADCQPSCLDRKPDTPSGTAPTDASAACPLPLDAVAAADLYRHFKAAAILRQDLELCGGLQVNREDLPFLSHYVLKSRLDKSPDKVAQAKVEPDLQAALEFFFTGFIAAQTKLAALTAGPIGEQALCAGKRLRLLPTRDLYEMLFQGNGNKPGPENDLVPRVYYFVEGCQPFDDRLKKDRWLASCIVANSAGPLSNQQVVDGYRAQYADEYVKHWNELIRKLWEFPVNTYHTDGPFNRLCQIEAGGQRGRRGASVYGEVIAPLSNGTTEAAVNALANSLQILEKRLQLLARAAPVGTTQSRDDFCMKVAQPFVALRDFESDASGKSLRPLVSLFSAYLRELDAVRKLVDGLKPYNYLNALTEVQKTIPGSESALKNLRLRRFDLMKALSGSPDIASHLDASLKQVEESVWDVLLRMAAEELQAKTWKVGALQAAQQILGQPATDCMNRAEKYRLMKEVLSKPASVLQSFCDREMITNCTPRNSFGDTLAQDLVLKQNLTTKLRDYMFPSLPTCPVPALAAPPTPGAPPAPPAPEALARASLIPQRIFFPDCKRDDFKLRFKNSGPLAASIECKPIPPKPGESWLWLACSPNPTYDGTVHSQLYAESPSRGGRGGEVVLRRDNNLLNPTQLCQGRRSHAHEGTRVKIELDYNFELCPARQDPFIEVTFQASCAEPPARAAAPDPLPTLPECIVEWKLPKPPAMPAADSSADASRVPTGAAR